MSQMCSHHIVSNLGYLQAHARAEARVKRGAKQYQCDVCKMWFFKDELNERGRE
jgi:hypothetical protein